MIVPKTEVIDCPECGAKIRVSVRDDGEAAVLGSEEVNPLEELKEL